MDGWMDGWVDGWLARRMGGWMSGWQDGWIERMSLMMTNMKLIHKLPNKQLKRYKIEKVATWKEMNGWAEEGRNMRK